MSRGPLSPRSLSEEEEREFEELNPDVLTDEELESLNDTDTMFYGSWLSGVLSSKGADYVREHRKELRRFLSTQLVARIVP